MRDAEAAEEYDPVMWACAGEFPGLQDRIIELARTPGRAAERQLNVVGWLLGDGLTDEEWRRWRGRPVDE